MPEFLNTTQAVLPAAADRVTVTSGAIHTFGSYAELTSSAPSDLAVSGVMQVPGSGFTEHAYTILAVATGAAASEVELFRLVGWNVMASTTWLPDPHGACTPLGIPIGTVTSGTRIAARMQYGDSSQSFGVAITYVTMPLDGDLETTATALDDPVFVSVTSGGSAWANGSYVEYTASTAAAWVINHIACSNSASNGFNEIGIATGAAASEVEICAIPGNPAQPSNHKTDALGILHDNVAASTRVAVRHRHSVASQTLFVWLANYNKPL